MGHAGPTYPSLKQFLALNRASRVAIRSRPTLQAFASLIFQGRRMSAHALLTPLEPTVDAR